MKNRAGRVSLSGQLVGFLREDGDQTSFTYTQEWLARPDAEPVSLTMPLRAQSYIQRGVHPFFDNLLPEGWWLDIVCKKLKISPEDRFGLLIGTCGECVGAVEIERIDAAEVPT